MHYIFEDLYRLDRGVTPHPFSAQPNRPRRFFLRPPDLRYTTPVPDSKTGTGGESPNGAVMSRTCMT